MAPFSRRDLPIAAGALGIAVPAVLTALPAVTDVASPAPAALTVTLFPVAYFRLGVGIEGDVPLLVWGAVHGGIVAACFVPAYEIAGWLGLGGLAADPAAILLAAFFYFFVVSPFDPYLRPERDESDAEGETTDEEVESDGTGGEAGSDEATVEEGSDETANDGDPEEGDGIDDGERSDGNR